MVGDWKIQGGKRERKRERVREGENGEGEGSGIITLRGN
jgi:hypothetical protein